MQSRCVWLWLAMALVTGPVLAEPAAPPNLAYFPRPAQVDTRDLRVHITEVLLADAPTGMNGVARATMQIAVQSQDVTTGQTVVQSSMSKVSSEIAGRKLKQVPMPTYCLLLDQQARLLALGNGDSLPPPNPTVLPGSPPLEVLKAALARGAGELISQGGVPLQALGLQCALPLLPDRPVQMGDTWQASYTCQFEGAGEATEEATVALLGLEAGLATFSSNLRYTLPEFEAPNPLLPGQKMKVENAVLELTDLVQEYELATSVVRAAHARMTMTLQAVSPDMTLPIKIKANLTYAAPAR
ncbi:MAG: hypothetical protein GX100_08270 [candidate division WS1 bacterium]|jgi:hypothetical protein|nr:hypothetical protein [candidate division WS1 bacterium]